MARRTMSISRERKFKLESQLEILGKLIKVEDFRTKEVQRNYLDKKLRLEIALEEVTLMVEAEGKKRVVKDGLVGAKDDGRGPKDMGDAESNMGEAIEKEAQADKESKKKSSLVGAKDDGSTGHGNLGEDGKPREDIDQGSKE